jgi:hypothetical protein
MVVNDQNGCQDLLFACKESEVADQLMRQVHWTDHVTNLMGSEK